MKGMAAGFRSTSVVVELETKRIVCIRDTEGLPGEVALPERDPVIRGWRPP